MSIIGETIFYFLSHFLYIYNRIRILGRQRSGEITIASGQKKGAYSFSRKPKPHLISIRYRHEKPRLRATTGVKRGASL
jgi:hypothetical protein